MAIVRTPFRSTIDTSATREAPMISVYPPTWSAEPDATEVLSPAQLDGAASGGSDDGTLPEGTVLGEYVVESKLGSGGGGSVYAARHLSTQARAAVKVLHPEMTAFPAMIKRFTREANAVETISHPNIVRVFAVGEVRPGQPYYVMELLEGRDLKRLLKDHGRFSPPEAIALMEPICAAVAAAHSAGIVHRDIKATNVFVVEHAGQRSIKLLDFGIAKLLNSESTGQGLTEPGSMLGTAHSMAPEQVRCERADERSDIYALGVLLYQLLTGHFPFQAPDPRQVALMHLQTPAPRPSLLAPVGSALDAIVLRCMEKQPARRYASVHELMRALLDALPSAQHQVPMSYDPAVGIYVEAAVGDESADDDDAMMDVCDVLDETEDTLTRAGYVLPVKSSSAVLAVKLLDTGSAAEVDAAETTFSALRRALDQRANAHPGVHLQISMTVSQAACRKTGDDIEVVGGPVLEVASWMNQDRTRVG
jgi:eukaryotic-like serine/threonine-protein kinase